MNDKSMETTASKKETASLPPKFKVLHRHTSSHKVTARSGLASNKSENGKDWPVSSLLAGNKISTTESSSKQQPPEEPSSNINVPSLQQGKGVNISKSNSGKYKLNTTSKSLKKKIKSISFNKLIGQLLPRAQGQGQQIEQPENEKDVSSGLDSDFKMENASERRKSFEANPASATAVLTKEKRKPIWRKMSVKPLNILTSPFSISRQISRENVKEAKDSICSSTLHEEIVPKEVETNLPEVLGFQSRILTEKMRRSLHEVLPYRKRVDYWYQIFNSFRDGFNFERLYSFCEKEQETILLIETENNDIFGAFVTEPWKRNSQNNFYGTGESFVFKYFFKPEFDSKPKENDDSGTATLLEVLDGEQKDERNDRVCEALGDLSFSSFKWTGKNECFMLSNSNYLAVGSGDSGFAILLHKSFKGTTNRSETFDNETLLSDHNTNNSNNFFVVRNLEVFGFSACKRNPKVQKALHEYATYVSNNKQENTSLLDVKNKSMFSTEEYFVKNVNDEKELLSSSNNHKNNLKIKGRRRTSVLDDEYTEYLNTVNGFSAECMLQQFRHECGALHRHLHHVELQNLTKQSIKVDTHLFDLFEVNPSSNEPLSSSTNIAKVENNIQEATGKEMPKRVFSALN